ncbi:MAG: vitamin K epoxide reductase family protein, partial [Candidatus Anammoxibacter sp.]
MSKNKYLKNNQEKNNQPVKKKKKADLVDVTEEIKISENKIAESETSDTGDLKQDQTIQPAPDEETRAEESQSKISNPKSSIQNPQSDFPGPQSSIVNQQSSANNPQSKIQNPKSGIGPVWTISIALTAALGLAISVYLTIHHYRIMSGLPDSQSFCSVSEYIDCDMVNTSSYSEFKGLPLALFGAGIYACVVCLIILSIFAKGMVLKRYISAITIIGLVSFCFSIYLAVVSVFILHAICILCVGTYFIN